MLDDVDDARAGEDFIDSTDAEDETHDGLAVGF
jgi:hypothetical protein